MKKKHLSYFLEGDYKWTGGGKFLYFPCQACTAPDATKDNSGRLNLKHGTVKCYQPTCTFSHKWEKYWKYVSFVQGNATGYKLDKNGVQAYLDVYKGSVPDDILDLALQGIDGKKKRNPNARPWLPRECKPIISGGTDYHDILTAYIENRGFEMDWLYDKFKLQYADTGNYSGRIIIPFKDIDGKFRYFQARDFLDRGKKKRWLNPKEEEMGVSKMEIMYNEEILTDPNVFELFLCEGVFDTYELVLGGMPSVTILGTELSDIHIAKIKSNRIKLIYLALDDGTFLKSLKVARKLLQKGLEVRYLDMREGDCNEVGYSHVAGLVDDSIHLTLDNLAQLKNRAVDANGKFATRKTDKTFLGPESTIISY